MNKLRTFHVFALATLFLGVNALNTQGQSDTISTVKINLTPGKIVASEIGIYALGMTAVGSAWYSNFEFENWHWFDDQHEWYQIDKAGHTFSTYQIANQSFKTHIHFGFPHKKALWYSTAIAFVAVSSVEIFDGFAAEWGASASDLVANGIGAGVFLAQQLIWDAQPIKLKFSYHPTTLYKQRPDVLGSNHLERLLKDYNAQQYWISANLRSFIPCSYIPKWLNLAVGYGAYNMISANTRSTNFESGEVPYRRFFISPDIDLEQIKVRSTFLRILLHAVNIIKIPLPTLEFNKKGVKFHPLY
jgi:hypothetical protein